MTIVGEDNTDIKLDENGQPVVDENGDFDLVSGDDCWKQDIRLEGMTGEGELFYEDADGDDAYGFGMMDFVQAENDEFTQTEIKQRVNGKLAKREYLDQMKTIQKISFENGVYTDEITIQKQNENDEYNMELTTNEVEVEEE